MDHGTNCIPTRPMMRNALSLAIALLVGTAACSLASSGPTGVGDQQLVLRAGESATVGGTTVRVLAIQDSRCPLDVQCIWQGDVVLMFVFSGAGDARTDTLRMNTTPKTTTYAGLLFEPTTVTPYPDTRVQQSDKLLTLRVTTAP